MTTEVEQKLLEIIEKVNVTVNQIAIEIDYQKVEMKLQRQEIQGQGEQIQSIQQKMEMQRQEIVLQGERLSHIAVKVGEIDERLKKWTEDNARFNVRLENYQRGSYKIFNPGIALMVGSSVAIVAGVILSIVREL